MKRNYIDTIYNFLNNTKGFIEDYEVKELLKVIDCDCDYNINNDNFITDLNVLNDLVECGDKEDDFYNKLIEIATL